MQEKEELEHTEVNAQPEESLYKLQLRFKKETILELALTSRDCFFELRSYITDLPDLYFQPSFHFQYEGKKINEYALCDGRYNELEKEIVLSDPQQQLKIDVVLDEYDYKSSKEIVRRINEFFRNPKAIISQIRSR